MNDNIKKVICARQSTNLKILEILNDYFTMYPDMRFGQALANLNIIEYDLDKQTHDVIDPFYDESVETFNRIPDIFKNLV